MNYAKRETIAKPYILISESGWVGDQRFMTRREAETKAADYCEQYGITYEVGRLGGRVQRATQPVELVQYDYSRYRIS